MLAAIRTQQSSQNGVAAATSHGRTPDSFVDAPARKNVIAGSVGTTDGFSPRKYRSGNTTRLLYSTRLSRTVLTDYLSFFEFSRFVAGDAAIANDTFPYITRPYRSDTCGPNRFSDLWDVRENRQDCGDEFSPIINLFQRSQQPTNFRTFSLLS